jgi:hypothetical protein
VLKLADILHIPISKQHHSCLYYSLMQMGMNHAILKNCIAIPRFDFEKALSGYPEVGNAYVELFSLINEFRLGRDNVEGQVYLVLAGLDKDELILLVIIQNPKQCIRSNE